MRNTLRVDKNAVRDDALFDIYRVMRPGEPPTVEAAETMFNGLFFDSERYDLSSVGRVKMNMRLEQDTADDMRVLRKEDVLAVLKVLVGPARRPRRNRRHRQTSATAACVRWASCWKTSTASACCAWNAPSRNACRPSTSTPVMPHDLINAKPAAAAVREFFGSSQLSQFMDQTNPLSEITHKRRLSALGPGGLTRERAGFEVRDVHPTHYGRICPIETPEGPNIGLINSLAAHARVNKYGFIESPYRRVTDNKTTEEVVYMSAMEESQAHPSLRPTSPCPIRACCWTTWCRCGSTAK